jgi:NADPH:quinone reductase-like Zn-dependent oxidoreductase
VLAASAVAFSWDDPLSGLQVGEVAEPAVPDGWVRVRVRAAALNQHDLWSLRGVGLKPEQLPMVLGCDAAGETDDGREVVVHAVVADNVDGDETNDPHRTLLSEKHPGTLAEYVAVPARNVVPKPASLSWAEAACLPTAWLTAYRMLFTQSGLKSGGRVLVQGAGGGVSTALVALARAAGFRVYVTSRDAAKRERAKEIGAHEAYEPGARLPERVDAVMETVGKATWDHSLKSLEIGGTLVVAGATTGDDPPADLRRVFFRNLRIVGSTMGTRRELADLIRFLDVTGVRPLVDSVRPLGEAREAFERLVAGEVFGKLVLTT